MIRSHQYSRGSGPPCAEHADITPAARPRKRKKQRFGRHLLGKWKGIRKFRRFITGTTTDPNTSVPAGLVTHLPGRLFLGLQRITESLLCAEEAKNKQSRSALLALEQLLELHGLTQLGVSTVPQHHLRLKSFAHVDVVPVVITTANPHAV
jgi:hypothetical protein